MKYLLLVSEEAETDIAEAIKWYAAIKPPLAREFLVNLDSLLDTISVSPYLFAQKHKKLRGATMKKFPFTIYFQVVGTNIEIFSVFHNKRNPKILKKRK